MNIFGYCNFKVRLKMLRIFRLTLRVKYPITYHHILSSKLEDVVTCDGCLTLK